MWRYGDYLTVESPIKTSNIPLVMRSRAPWWSGFSPLSLFASFVAELPAGKVVKPLPNRYEKKSMDK
jgi:hypothetical protein